MLMQHKQEQRAWEREQSAFAGYCAGLAFNLAFHGDLKGFDKFYIKPKPDEPPPKSKVERWRDDCKRIGLMAGNLTDEQLAVN